VKQVVAYGLLLLDLVVGAAVLWIAIWLVLWLVRRVRRAGGPPAAESGDGHAPHSVKRRCQDCGLGWWATPDREVSVSGLRLRRILRHYRRRKKRRVGDWAARQGYSRCPSCFSRRVRDSHDQTKPEPRLERRRRRLPHDA
jgi:hypothetical protein